MSKLSLDLAGLTFKNPVLTASGTFGYGEEFDDFIDVNRLGGFVVKGTTLEARQGNPYPRMAETPSGMLNAVGLQNKGVDYFVRSIYPRIQHYSSHIFVNVSGSTVDDYVATTEALNDLDAVAGIELNISCPNVKQGGLAFGVDAGQASLVTAAVRKVCRKPLMVKLSPNVTDIVGIARAVEDAGADLVSLVNTFLGMAIDIGKKKPILSTVTGGLSGPCIKPIALRMVWQVAKAVKIPVVGMGGILCANDAVEFLLAGASAVQVGTANFIDPAVTIKIVDGLEKYLDAHKMGSVRDLIGLVNR